jgi:hypothetical protein
MNGQRDLVLKHLERTGSISSWEAIMNYRITRLAEYIRQLRTEGYNIVSEWQESGDKRYVKYTIERKNAEQMEFA